MDAAGLKYEVDGDGDYKLTLSGLEGDRTQLVFVRSAVETLGNMRIREVWSPAGKLPEATDAKNLALRAAITESALVDANDKKLGGWVLKGKDKDRALFFVAQIPADLGGDDLRSAVVVVAKSADNLEQVLEAASGAQTDTY